MTDSNKKNDELQSLQEEYEAKADKLVEQQKKDEEEQKKKEQTKKKGQEKKKEKDTTKKTEKPTPITGYEEIKAFAPDPLFGKSKFSVEYWRTWWVKRKVTKQAMIHMELANGLYRTRIIAIESGNFKIGNNTYLIDDQSKHYNVDMKMYEYFYHESFSLPIKQKFPLTDVKLALEKSGLTEVIYATNPKTLQEFLVSRVAEGIMAGASEDANWKQVKLMLGITMVSTIILLIYILFKTGFFDSASGALGI